MTGGTSVNSSGDIADLDTSEVYDSDIGSWATSGAKLPQPMNMLRAANIDDRVLIFGKIILAYIHYYTVITQK